MHHAGVDRVGVGNIDNHEGSVVGVGAEEERQPSITFGVAAAVIQMSATNAPQCLARTTPAAPTLVPVCCQSRAQRLRPANAPQWLARTKTAATAFASVALPATSAASSAC